jgi:DNA-binding XRE family transcriptional regulator
MEPATNEAFKLYRSYLGISQSELASMMAVTATTISRWETGSVELAFHSTAMMHIRSLVGQKLSDDMRRCFARIKPELTIGEFEGLFGIPSSEIQRGRDGKLYIGIIQILKHHDHVIKFCLDDGVWLAIGEGGKVVALTKQLLGSLRHQTRPSRFEKTRKPRSAS